MDRRLFLKAAVAAALVPGIPVDNDDIEMELWSPSNGKVCRFIGNEKSLRDMHVDWIRYTEYTETGEKILEIKPMNGELMRPEVI